MREDFDNKSMEKDQKRQTGLKSMDEEIGSWKSRS